MRVPQYLKTLIIGCIIYAISAMFYRRLQDPREARYLKQLSCARSRTIHVLFMRRRCQCGFLRNRRFGSISEHNKTMRCTWASSINWVYLGYLLEHAMLYVESSTELLIGSLCVEIVGKSAVCCTLGLASGLDK